jgi:hypothetical protein
VKFAEQKRWSMVSRRVIFSLEFASIFVFVVFLIGKLGDVKLIVQSAILRLAIQKPDIKKSTWAGAKIEKKNDINTQD